MKNTPYELLMRYVGKECSDNDKANAEDWINKSIENARIFEELKAEWTEINNPSDKVKIDTKKVLDRIISTTGISTVKLFTRRAVILTASAVACIALLAGLTVGLYLQPEKQNPISYTTVFAPQGQKAKAVLPDGSEIWLNSGSKLVYSTTYNDITRDVTLSGEAFFKVAHNNNVPFIVNAAGTCVKVQGTSFNISAYTNDKIVKVALTEGSVSILRQNDKQLISMLEPNQTAEITRSDFNCRLIAEDPAIVSLWTQNVLRIYNEHITDAVKKLERWYGVKIEIKNPDVNYRYSFVVKTESLREMIELINKVTPVKYEINGDKAVISYIR